MTAQMPTDAPSPPAPLPGAVSAVSGPYVNMPDHLQAPPGYAIRLPAENTVDYAVEFSAIDGARANSSATLTVAYDMNSFSVQFKGQPDPEQGWRAVQTIASSGARNDNGFAPLQASTDSGAAATSRIRLNRAYDPQAGTEEQGSDQAIVQDGSSMLLQLIGMAVSDSSQLTSPVRIAVAGRAGVSIVTFELVGIETTTVPLGVFDAWHLVQLSAPGETRMEVWLAPALGWYPVQLRTTAPDGAVAIQRLLHSRQPVQSQR